MISFIRGLVADTTENAVILENNGIGYEIFMTGSSIEQVSRIDGTLGNQGFGFGGEAVGIPSLRYWNSNLRL